MLLCLAVQSCPALCDHMDCSPPGPSVHGDSPDKNMEWVAMPSSKGSSQPGIEHRSPTLQADSLLSEAQGKPMNTRVGSLSLLQEIFPTQESNQDLLHCKQILYQLSYQGSPTIIHWPELISWCQLNLRGLTNVL